MHFTGNDRSAILLWPLPILPPYHFSLLDRWFRSNSQCHDHGHDSRSLPYHYRIWWFLGFSQNDWNCAPSPLKRSWETLNWIVSSTKNSCFQGPPGPWNHCSRPRPMTFAASAASHCVQELHWSSLCMIWVLPHPPCKWIFDWGTNCWFLKTYDDWHANTEFVIYLYTWYMQNADPMSWICCVIGSLHLDLVLDQLLDPLTGTAHVDGPGSGFGQPLTIVTHHHSPLFIGGSTNIK